MSRRNFIESRPGNRQQTKSGPARDRGVDNILNQSNVTITRGPAHNTQQFIEVHLGENSTTDVLSTKVPASDFTPAALDDLPMFKFNFASGGKWYAYAVKSIEWCVNNEDGVNRFYALQGSEYFKTVGKRLSIEQVAEMHNEAVSRSREERARKEQAPAPAAQAQAPAPAPAAQVPAPAEQNRVIFALHSALEDKNRVIFALHSALEYKTSEVDALQRTIRNQQELTQRITGHEDPAADEFGTDPGAGEFDECHVAAGFDTDPGAGEFDECYVAAEFGDEDGDRIDEFFDKEDHKKRQIEVENGLLIKALEQCHFDAEVDEHVSELIKTKDPTLDKSMCDLMFSPATNA